MKRRNMALTIIATGAVMAAITICLPKTATPADPHQANGTDSTPVIVKGHRFLTDSRGAGDHRTILPSRSTDTPMPATRNPLENYVPAATSAPGTAVPSNKSTTVMSGSRNEDGVSSGNAEKTGGIPQVDRGMPQAGGFTGQHSIRMPLAFQGGGEADTMLSSGQQAAVRKIQEDFASATQSASVAQSATVNPSETVDPSSPDYLQRWITAQQEADSRLRLVLGWQGYLQYSLNLARQELIDSGGHRINPPRLGPL